MTQIPLNNKNENLDTDWDFRELPKGHEARFLAKLNASQPKRNNSWRLMAVAASMILLVSLLTWHLSQTNLPVEEPMFSSKQTQETHDYFESLVAMELSKLKKVETVATQSLIDDTMKEMKLLDDDYQKIMLEFKNQGESKQLIHALITNFQTRINFLENVMTQIEIINQQIINQNEKSI